MTWTADFSFITSLHQFEFILLKGNGMPAAKEVAQQ